MAANLMTPALLEQVNTAQKREVLIDWFEDSSIGTFDILSESAGENGALVVEGKVGEADKATANGRRYGRKILEREINRLQPRIKQRSLFAAVDHPGDGKTRIRDTGALCTGLRLEANGDVIARYEIIPGTGAGGDLAAVIRAGGCPGMSSRGIGSTRMTSEGVHDVQDDFKLYGYDFVADPACQTAYPSVVKEDVDTNEVTEAVVRQDHPEIVRAIEEKARQQAAQTVQEEMAEQNAIFEAEIANRVAAKLSEERAEMEERIQVEMLQQVRAQVAEDFSTKLLRALAEQESQVREQVRSELLADPTVAGAKQTLEQIQTIIQPFAAPGTPTAPVLGEKVETVGAEELEKLRREIDALKEDVAQAEAHKKLAADKARYYGYALYVEQEVSHRADAADIKESLGDLDAYESIQEIRDALQEAIDNADEVRDRVRMEAESRTEKERRLAERKIQSANQRAQRAETEAERVRRLVQEEVGSLRDRFSNLLDSRERTIEEQQDRIAKLERSLLDVDHDRQQARLIAFAERRTLGHPRADDILAMVESGRLRTEDEVLALAEEWDYQGAEPGGASENVRRSLGRGREVPTEEERRRLDEMVGPAPRNGSNHNPVPNLEGFGVDMSEIKQLSGIGQKSGRRRRF